MHYLLKGIPLIAALTAATLPSRGAPLEYGPLQVAFTPTQLQGENYIFQITQHAGGQIIVGGERIGFYENNRWNFLEMKRRPAIRALFVERDRLWVASLNEIGYVSLPLSRSSKYQVVNQSELSQAGDFWHLAKSDKHIVATTKEEIWFLDTASYQVQRIKLATKQRLSLVTLGNKLLVAQPGSGIWEVSGNQLLPFANPLPDKTDTAWLWGNESLILTIQNLYKNDGDGYRVVTSTQALNRDGVIVSATPWGPYLAVATYAKGLALIDTARGTTKFVSRASGLPSAALVHVFVDSADRLWAGTRQGISLLEPLTSGHQVLFSNTPLFAARSSGLFVGFEEHATYYRENGSEESLPRTYEFATTTSGVALGLWGKVRLGDVEIAAPGNRIGAIAEVGDGQLLVSSGEKLHLLSPRSGDSETITAPPTEIISFSRNKNELWATTVDGNIYHSPSQPPIIFNKVGAVPLNSPAKLHHLGNILITAFSDGICFGGKMQPVERTTGIHAPKLTTTADGSVWAVGEQGGEWRLGQLRRRNETVWWETVEAKGLSLLPEIRSITSDGDVLTVCGGFSVLEFKISALRPHYRITPPQLLFSDREATPGQPLPTSPPPTTLPADQNSLTFTATLPYDEFGERPAYERRLLPTETAWVPTKAGEKVSYPSLSSRSYTLEVRATHLGRTGATATYAFVVLPPWYLTWTAFSAYAALLGALGFSAYRLRTRQIRARNAELERIVGERTRELAEASAAKTEFVASMSHEIRNPMNGVIGLVNILRDQPTLPKQADYLRKLYHCAEQLRATVDDILDFSRIEARRVDIESQTFDLLDTLDAAAATIDPTGTTITFQSKPPVGTALRGDAAKLRQIFANYLTNALKYGVPPGARVGTILTPTPDGRMRLTVSVTSSGPTIEKDKLDKLFESFTRGDDAIERNIRGTGLGLAICKRYAEAMGGEVGAVSTNGETTFYLNVPFARVGPAVAGPIPGLDAEPRPALPAKALAIEDEDYNRIVLGDILAKMNYSVDWATTGEEALRLARENGYDIILTDYRLPDTNGVELTKKILTFVSDPKPAVFAVTAYSTRERRAECLAAGMAGFISKPITLEKLRTTLYSWGEGQLTKISLEAATRPLRHAVRPPEIERGWVELLATAATDPRRAAESAHKLNNVCRSLHHLDLAEQLELLEGALERGEPTGELVAAIERLLRA